MFEELERINIRPKPFEFDTTRELWTDKHTSKQMLSFHLNGEIDVASRNTTFIDKSVEWISSYFHVGAGTKIADFGCGPGLYTTRLARKQAEVTGIDFSTRSIEYAQEIAVRENLPIEYINQNYLEYGIIPILLSQLNLENILDNLTFLGFFLGSLITFGGLIGDIIGSFIKRRSGIERGHSFIFLDQLGFLVVGMIFVFPLIPWPIEWFLVQVPITFILHIFANLFGYFTGIQDVPL